MTASSSHQGPALAVVTLIGGVRAAWSGAAAGDLRTAGPHGGDALVRFASASSRATASLGEVHWLEQVHGRSVVVVGDAVGTPAPPAGAEATVGGATAGGARVRGVADGPGDALVSVSAEVALSVLVADCVPLAMASPEGIFAAVHAGWRGLVAGVVEAAAGAMSDLGATSVVGALGPCIHPCCYEFSEPDLARLAAALGTAVRRRTADGRPALDLPAAASAAMARAGVKEVGGVDRCTGCGGGLFSHRVRREAARQALVVWRDPDAEGR
jgi:copper oxidase (laccase) domain-containing protein